MLFGVLVSGLSFVGVPGIVAQSKQNEQSKSRIRTVRVMTFNVLEGGNRTGILGAKSPLRGKPRYAQIVRVIRKAKADVVAIQEGGEALFKHISTELKGWHRRSGVVSRFPIQEAHQPSKNRLGLHRIVVAPGKSLVVLNAHWWPRKYGPFLVRELLVAKKDVSSDAVVKAMQSPAWYKRTVEMVAPYLKDGTPTVVLGDFNEPSHLDWTKKAARAKAERFADPKIRLRTRIAWPGSRVLVGAGLKDAFRTAHPDEAMLPGNTWTPPYPTGTRGRCAWELQVLDRIDIIYFAGTAMKLRDAQVVGEDKRHARIVVTPWPSDHRAVVATFEF